DRSRSQCYPDLAAYVIEPGENPLGAVQIVDELLDLSLDLVADRPDLLERQPLGVPELPADPAHARSDRAYLLAAGGDRDVGPRQVVGVELVRDVVARVDAQLQEGFEDRRVR